MKKIGMLKESILSVMLAVFFAGAAIAAPVKGAPAVDADPFMLYPTPYEVSGADNSFLLSDGEELSCSGNTPIERFNNCQLYNRSIESGSDLHLNKTDTDKMMERLSIEIPVRCEVPLQTNEIITGIPVSKKDFMLKKIEKTDPFPRYEVTGYTFESMPLDMALQDLVEEAGVTVYSDDGVLPYLSAEGVRGELKDVIQELAEAGGVYVTYEAPRKALYLSRYGKFQLKLPGGRYTMYAFIDGLKGMGIPNVNVDWKTNTLYMRLSMEEEGIVNRLVQSFSDNPNLALMDIQVFLLYASPDEKTINWQRVVEDFGASKVNMAVNGLTGKMLITDHVKKPKAFLDAVKKYADYALVAEGVAVIPNNWFVRFDIGQCIRFTEQEKDLSILFRSVVSSKRGMEGEIALDTINGEITSFKAFYNVDDTLYIIGIPGKVFNKIGDKMEYMIVMKPKMVRLVK